MLLAVADHRDRSIHGRGCRDLRGDDADTVGMHVSKCLFIILIQ